jgi:Family of unknown function (DUF6166)
MRVYVGMRTAAGCKVWVGNTANEFADYELPMQLELANHSPTRFEWGYGGSGPAQLALALLTDCLKDNELALRFYQSFKLRMTSVLPHSSWTLSEVQVGAAVAAIERDKVA